MEKTTESRHFELQTLASGVFAALACDGGAAVSNAGLIDLGGRVLALDSFLTPQAAGDLKQAALEHLGQVPNLVANTHYHNDHIWGNQAFLPEAQIIATHRTRDLIATEGQAEYKEYEAVSAQRLDSLAARYRAANEEQRRELELWIGYYGGIVEALPRLKVIPPGIAFDSRLEIHGETREVVLIEVLGAHTGSDSVLHLPGDGIVFMGDLLFVGCHPYLADGDPDELLKALRALSQLDAAIFVPGHGPVGVREDLARMIEYVEECQHTARKLAAQGILTVEKELPIPEVWRDWRLPNFYTANIKFLLQQQADR